MHEENSSNASQATPARKPAGVLGALLRGTGRKPGANRFEGAGLALVPFVVVLTFAVLLFPRAAIPDDVPLPQPDAIALQAIEAHEHALLAQFDEAGLSAETRALGTQILALHRTIATRDRLALQASKDRVEQARIAAVNASGLQSTFTLMLVQRDKFVAALEGYLQTGEERADLVELGGPFIPTMRAAGWLHAQKLTPDHEEIRVLYKRMWASEVGLEEENLFGLSLDENRVLYSLYLRAPHAPESLRARFAVSRTDPQATNEARRLVDDEEAKAAEKWRLQKVVQLAEFDVAYPRDYALGIAQYRAGAFPASADAFRRWLDSHPNGPYTLRAQNYLKASLQAANL